MDAPRYFDRQGKPIDLITWDKLWEDPGYRFVKRSWVVPDRVEVVTVWEGFDPYRVEFRPDAPPRIFRIAILHWREGKIREVDERGLVVREQDAVAQHAALVTEIEGAMSKHT